MKNANQRGKWGSRLGFILATSGAAIGLGNIQRFPYMTAEGGGSAFVFIYIFFVILLGVPLILVEFSLGRHTQRNPVCAIDKIRPKSLWKGVGALGILTAFFILSYYSVIGGWTLGYIVQTFFNIQPNLPEFASNPVNVIGYMALFISLTMMIVIKGVKKGIERYSKIFMPLLFFLILILVARSLTLPGCVEGIKYYLKPDFSELTPRVFLLAMGQAFFSLSIGEAVLITYGSYTTKSERLPSSAGYIAGFDLLIALLSGLIIFPAIFSFGESPHQGVGLTFMVLPKIFLKMPFGNLFGAIFFLLLAFAAITTSIALLEMPVMYLIDSKKWSRKKAVWFVGTLAFLVGIPSALSHGASPSLTKLPFTLFKQESLYNLMDFVWGNLAMALCGGLLAIFVGWIWGAKKAAKELQIGCKGFARLAPTWIFIIKYLAPTLILIILLSLLIT